MYFKFIKFVVLLSLLVCCGFAGRVLYSCFFNLVVQGKDPRHTRLGKTAVNRVKKKLLESSFVIFSRNSRAEVLVTQ